MADKNLLFLGIRNSFFKNSMENTNTPIKKWVWAIQWQFTKEEIQMASKCVENIQLH